MRPATQYQNVCLEILIFLLSKIFTQLSSSCKKIFNKNKLICNECFNPFLITNYELEISPVTCIETVCFLFQFKNCLFSNYHQHDTSIIIKGQRVTFRKKYKTANQSVIIKFRNLCSYWFYKNYKYCIYMGAFTLIQRCVLCKMDSQAGASSIVVPGQYKESISTIFS